MIHCPGEATLRKPTHADLWEIACASLPDAGRPDVEFVFGCADSRVVAKRGADRLNPM